MKDKEINEGASTAPEAKESSKCKALHVGLILLGKVVGGLLFAVGILLLFAVVYNARVEQRTPDFLPISTAISWLIIPGVCLWIRAGRPAFGFLRGVCTLIGSWWVSGGIVLLLTPAVLDLMGQNVSEYTLPPKSSYWMLIIVGLVLGIPLLLFGFRPKMGLSKSVNKRTHLITKNCIDDN